MESLQELRKAKNLTQLGLAESLGVDVATVSGWERGKHQPTPSIRERYAEALGITVKALREIIYRDPVK
jgi:transcriptional regulator with XRE-family HTH domain